MKFSSGPDLTLQVEMEQLKSKIAENAGAADKIKRIEEVLEMCKDHTLFKLPPVSTMVSKIREILNG